jgi:hypothetical protein
VVKDRLREAHPHISQSLSLSLVDDHCKGWLNRKLAPPEHDW